MIKYNGYITNNPDIVKAETEKYFQEIFNKNNETNNINQNTPWFNTDHIKKSNSILQNKSQIITQHITKKELKLHIKKLAKHKASAAELTGEHIINIPSNRR